MNENNWSPQHNDPSENREPGFYQTGSTRPPKNRGGLIAVLLVAVIFLGGIASTLGIMNIKLFRQISSDSNEAAPVSFSQSDNIQDSKKPESTDDTPANMNTDVTIQLNQAPEAVENIPQTGGLSLQEIYKKAIDSVVSISCRTPSGSFTGTGVIISRDGYVITNCHVVEGASSIEVLLRSGEVLSAQLVGADAVSDLAVLYVDCKNLTSAEFGDSTSMRVGDAVVAIGDPLGIELRGTMTDGIVSAINRDITMSGRTMTLIQTNAALNSGNSGGPLLNCYGQVVGINTMKIGDYMSDAGVEGLGFAIPSTTVKEIVDQLMSQGFVSGRPSLGITGETVSPFIQLYYNLPQGVYIVDVDEDSDAAQKGIAPGDILVSLDGERTTDTDTLNALLYTHDAGDKVDVIIYRSGRQYAVELTLDEAAN